MHFQLINYIFNLQWVYRYITLLKAKEDLYVTNSQLRLGRWKEAACTLAWMEETLRKNAKIWRGRKREGRGSEQRHYGTKQKLNTRVFHISIHWPFILIPSKGRSTVLFYGIKFRKVKSPAQVHRAYLIRTCDSSWAWTSVTPKPALTQQRAFHLCEQNSLDSHGQEAHVLGKSSGQRQKVSFLSSHV